MPTYTFVCASKKHADESTRRFVQVVQHGEMKSIEQFPCPECGRAARRDLVADLATVNTVGSKPIPVTGSKHGIGHETQYAFGRFKRNPDGSVDRNHAAFRDTGEMNRFMNGANQMGDPVCNDAGVPLRRQDGSIIRRGAKLVKYGANATPTRDGVSRNRFRPPPGAVQNDWTAEDNVKGSNAEVVKQHVKNRAEHVSPRRERRA